MRRIHRFALMVRLRHFSPRKKSFTEADNERPKQYFGPFQLPLNIQQLMNRGGHREDLFRRVLDFGSTFLGASDRLAGHADRAIPLDNALLSSEFSLL